jgi:hypothetical protein
MLTGERHRSRCPGRAVISVSGRHYARRQQLDDLANDRVGLSLGLFASDVVKDPRDDDVLDLRYAERSCARLEVLFEPSRCQNDGRFASAF